MSKLFAITQTVGPRLSLHVTPSKRWWRIICCIHIIIVLLVFLLPFHFAHQLMASAGIMGHWVYWNRQSSWSPFTVFTRSDGKLCGSAQNTDEPWSVEVVFCSSWLVVLRCHDADKAFFAPLFVFDIEDRQWRHLVAVCREGG